MDSDRITLAQLADEQFELLRSIHMKVESILHARLSVQVKKLYLDQILDQTNYMNSKTAGNLPSTYFLSDGSHPDD